ncbi:MAG: hypothetical protein HY908_36045 [Myxococcales bacterium]|nr:hypothetical protein [Myxococcales bacterium]
MASRIFGLSRRPATLAALGLVGALAAGLGACATLATSSGGDTSLPNAGLGPFRPLKAGEIGNSRPAPYGLRDDASFERDVAVLDADGDPATLGVVAYAARTTFGAGVEPEPSAPPNEIVRHTALDGRSFDRGPPVVLAPAAAWEGGTVGAPAALEVEGEVYLYYAAAGGIGLARSADGVAFAREDAPVLGPASAGWDDGLVPRSPSVVRLPDGSFRMFYEVALGADESAIGEAASADGLVWQRLGEAPVLARRPELVDDLPAYDGASVGAPSAVLWVTSEGRAVLGVYYAATAEDGTRSIALAARYGTDGALARGLGPVFGSDGDLDPTEPCIVRFASFAFLYATERAGSAASQDFPAVAVGVAPATVTLPPPEW